MFNIVFKFIHVTSTYYNSWYLGYKGRWGQSTNFERHVLSFNPIRINTKYPNMNVAHLYGGAWFVWFLFTGIVKKFLYPNYIEVFLSLSIIKRKWLGPSKWSTTHLVFLVKCWIYMSYFNLDKLVAHWKQVLEFALPVRDLLWIWT